MTDCYCLCGPGEKKSSCLLSSNGIINSVNSYVSWAVLWLIVARLSGGICHHPDKYLTRVCNTHGGAPSAVSVKDTAATVLSCWAGRPLAFLWEIIQTIQGQAKSKLLHPQRDEKDMMLYSQFLIHSAVSPTASSLNVTEKTNASPELPKVFACKDTSWFLGECWLWSVMFCTHEKTSLGLSTRQKEKGGGWLFCILGGLPPLVGKPNIYILQLELLFSHFIFHNIDYTLSCCVECRCKSVSP